MFDPKEGNAAFNDFTGFVKQEASLMCLMILANDHYELTGIKLPPHQLQFDCSGCIRLENDVNDKKAYEAFIEGGEIKSASHGMRVTFPALITGVH
jgi:hypothetical protein